MPTIFVRSLVPLALVPLALVAAACGPSASDSSALSEELKKDLAAASTPPLELAGTGGAYQPMRFVSEIEQANGSAPVQRARAPRRVAAQSADVQQDEKQSPAPDVAQEVQVAEAPEPVQESPAPQPDVPRVPTVAPRPSALPVDVPTVQETGGRDGYGRGGIGVGRGDGVGIGDVIGVVIRGGGVGPDHCPPRRRGGRPRFPILP